MPTGSIMFSAPGAEMPNAAQNESTKKFMYLKKNRTASGATTPSAAMRRSPGRFSSPSAVKNATPVSASIRKQNRQSHQP